MRNYAFWLIMSLLLMCSSGCMYAMRFDGEYKGKVIDFDSRKPIEGAVVLGVWYKETPTVAGSVSHFYDARETLTDKNGDFSIPGMGLSVMSNLEPMYVYIFKAGYGEKRLAPWDVAGRLYDDKEGKVIFEMGKLSIEQRRDQHAGGPLIPASKRRMLIKELNVERKALGLSLYPEED